MNTESLLVSSQEYLLEKGQKGKLPSQPSPPGFLSGNVRLSCTSLSPSPRLKEALTTPLRPYSCPDRPQFALLGHFKIPDSSGHPRGEKDRKGKDSLQRKEVIDSEETGGGEHGPRSTSTRRSLGPVTSGSGSETKLFLCFTHFHVYHHFSLPTVHRGWGEKVGREKLSSFCISIKYLFLA